MLCRPTTGNFSPAFYLFIAVIFAASLSACSDSDDVNGATNQSEEDCTPDQTWNPIDNVCVTIGGEEDAGPVADADGEEDTGGNGGDECGGGPGTTITGTVTIPSGELPLPDVTVYVPATDPDPISSGATCEPCDDALSGNPITETLTGINGRFSLTQAPSGDEVPLVIEVGKWRRQVTLENVEPCQEYEITDLDKTRLPRNQEEGNIPQFGVSTGGCDALGCLLRKIGIDESEFTPEDEDGRVHLFAGRDGTTRYDNSLNDGASLTPAWNWWDDLDNLLDYDIVALSCECNNNGGDKSNDARQALQDFTEAGGRAFLSHLQYIWLSEGTDDFQSVADWATGMAPATGQVEDGIIDTSFPKGQDLREWMYQTGTTPAGEFPIHETRGSIESINEDIATQWVWIESEGMDFEFPGFEDFFPDPPPELVQYFSFNTPIAAHPNDQCGRLVFSDIHVASGQQSSPDHPFPTGCTDEELTPQEKALVFMLFDLARCIIPDKGDLAGR